MKRALTSGLAAAIAFSPLATGGAERDQVEVANYQRGARIIQVPQSDDRDEDQANSDYRERPALPNDGGEELTPPPRQRAAPPKASSRMESHVPTKKIPKESAGETVNRPVQTPAARNTPRGKPRDDSMSPPPPSGPRRAVLSAPPPLAVGPTPIRPTPNFESKAGAAEKFANPAVSEVSEIVPPRGYRPPAFPAQPAPAATAPDEPGDGSTEK